MDILTTRFGALSFSADAIITFPTGMVGFASQRRYILKSHQDNADGIQWLQSVDEGDLAFPLVDPALFCPDYKIPLDSAERDFLQIEKPTDARVFAVMTIPHDNPEGFWINLKGPVIINTRARVGMQLIINDDAYPLRHHVLTRVA